jgi:hypothetical protein
MLEFLKKIFCAAEADTPPAPYKVEASATVVPDFPVKKAEPKAKAKKPAVKKATTRKPKTPKV